MPGLPKHIPIMDPQSIPRAKWDLYPWNRWTFNNVREVVATTEVWRGDGAVWELPRHTTNFDSLEFSNFADESCTVSEWLTNDFNDGMIILSNGMVVYERYRNSMSNRSLHLSQSVAKSVTASVAGILVDCGLLDPERLITDYIPELHSGAYAGATLRHALDMASGVNYVEDYEAADSHIAAMDIAAGWKLPREGFDSPNNMWEHILSLHETTRVHGHGFNYRSIETEVVAQCMERVTNKRLADLISEELWQKLGCEESASFTIDRGGYCSASGGFNATLRDYARFGQMLCDDGNGNGKQIVPSNWVTDTMRPDALSLDDFRQGLFPNGGYRNQFWLRDRDQKIMMARGIYGQLIYVDQARDLVAVVMASWPESLSINRSTNTLRVIDAITDQL